MDQRLSCIRLKEVAGIPAAYIPRKNDSSEMDLVFSSPSIIFAVTIRLKPAGLIFSCFSHIGNPETSLWALRKNTVRSLACKTFCVALGLFAGNLNIFG